MRCVLQKHNKYWKADGLFCELLCAWCEDRPQGILLMSFEIISRDLQDRLALVDLMTRPGGGNGWIEFLVKKLLDVKIKMYQEKKHARPHVHIDYGPERHAASYSIPEGTRLVGELSSKYDQAIGVWIQENQELLLQLWRQAQEGKPIESIISQIEDRT